MFSRVAVYFAYSLKASGSYQAIKRFCWDFLENPAGKAKSYFDSFMICLVFLSVYLLLYETGYPSGGPGDAIEWGILVVLIVEYLLRLWVYSDSHEIIIAEYEKAAYLNIRFKIVAALGKALFKKIEYVVSPFAIIDLLAILPSYRPLRILRIFLIFRLFKLFRYSDSIRVYADILAGRRFELLSLLIFTGFLLFIAAVSIYVFEYPEEDTDIRDLFDAFYWAIVTLATVGYGDITPHTPGGRLVAIILIFTSIGILAFFTSILIAAFNEKMPELRENKILTELKRRKGYVIICGFGRVGQEVAGQLAKDGQTFVVIDKDGQNIALARKNRYPAICADATRNEVLINAGICRGADTILCITGDDVVNVYVTLTSRHLNKRIRIVSRANYQENQNKLYQAGADNVILPFQVAGLLVAEYLGQPVAFEALSGVLRQQGDIAMETVLVDAESPLDRRQIGQLQLQQWKLTLLGVISGNAIHLKHKNKYRVKQQHFYFNPEAHFELRQGDLIVVLGHKFGIEHFRSELVQRRLRGKALT